ncbi:MAG: hypothetical protein JSS91_09930 [Bacteroidetes bacterium]|nr:hypothetical protein [Bacteroidota bacterium]
MENNAEKENEPGNFQNNPDHFPEDPQSPLADNLTSDFSFKGIEKKDKLKLTAVTLLTFINFIFFVFVIIRKLT